MNYGLANGYAAIRAYMIYNNDTFLAYAEECWNSNQAYALTDADFSDTFTLKDFPLQSSCQGITMAGGVFWETDISNPSIDGLGTGYFLILSALLAKATSNQTYLIAAQSSAAFIKAHLYNINSVVQDTISARENDSCSTSGNMWPYNAGLMIEGLATLYSFTQNATMQSLLNDAIVAAVQNTVWVADNGIIASGTQKLGDNMLARGLLVAYSHNATSAEIRTYIEAFLGVQYNAIIDLATANGTNIYTASWSGPPSEQYSASNQITALTVLIGAILLQDNSTSSNSSPISTSTLSPIRSHTTVPVGALIGGIVGGVILLITLIIIPTYLLRHKRQQQIGQSNKNGLVPFMLSFAVTSAPTTQSTRGVTTATNNKVVPHNLPEHRGSFSQTIGTEISPATLIPVSVAMEIHPQQVQNPFRSSNQRAREDMTTEELVRVLNERLQPGSWDTSEMPPMYDM